MSADLPSLIAQVTGPLGALVLSVAVLGLFVTGAIVSGKVIDRLITAGEKRDEADGRRAEVTEGLLRELTTVVREQRRG